MPSDDTLRELASKWEAAGDKAREKGHDDAATALIGCAQGLVNLIDSDG